jgi:hypothetical protein
VWVEFDVQDEPKRRSPGRKQCLDCQRKLTVQAADRIERSAKGSCDYPQAQMTASRNTAAQTAIAATNAESNARSFLRSVRDVSHQPSYVRMLRMVPSPQ